jgi:hypothetical protein
MDWKYVMEADVFRQEELEHTPLIDRIVPGAFLLMYCRSRLPGTHGLSLLLSAYHRIRNTCRRRESTYCTRDEMLGSRNMARNAQVSSLLVRILLFTSRFPLISGGLQQYKVIY